jgi:uncharacterized protein YejL (UPF0352 family)
VLLHCYFNPFMHDFCKELVEHKENLELSLNIEGVMLTNNAVACVATSDDLAEAVV